MQLVNSHVFTMMLKRGEQKANLAVVTNDNQNTNLSLIINFKL